MCTICTPVLIMGTFLMPGRVQYVYHGCRGVRAHTGCVSLVYSTSVYRVSLKQPNGSSLVVNHCMADVQVTSYITVTLVLVPVEISTSISYSHAATYVVNAYVSKIRVYLR